ncbi:hypothetical protein ANN_26211 [Periplaneta americana]|uniref:Uncharacterized protein n=1 Tax=Periplaneta americana TaxID=6978 RepID=A0ABQ8S5A5_PERAM|nr:hypothetical protein ANN_26211 [Periplaneta americana]
MAGLCEGGNEPPGSLKAKEKELSGLLVEKKLSSEGCTGRNGEAIGVAQSVKALACRSEVALGRGEKEQGLKIPVEKVTEQAVKLIGYNISAICRIRKEGHCEESGRRKITSRKIGPFPANRIEIEDMDRKIIRWKFEECYENH